MLTVVALTLTLVHAGHTKWHTHRRSEALGTCGRIQLPELGLTATLIESRSAGIFMLFF